MDTEILNEFKTESKQLIEDILKLLTDIENSENEFPGEKVDQFALKIDRIMGASKTLAMLDPENKGLVLMGQIAGICKSTGYKALAKKNIQSIPIFAAFWFDAIEVVSSLVDAIEDPVATNTIVAGADTTLKKRLEWLVAKVA